MTYQIEQFDFEAVEQIPVRENDWATMLQAFMESDHKVIKREFGGKSASNAAGAIRKAAQSLGLPVDVVTMDGCVYVQKA